MIFVAHCAGASVVSLDFDLDTLDLAASARVAADKDRNADLRLTPRGGTRLGTASPIAAFDEEANGRLEQVDVRFDFDLPVTGFSVLDFFDDLDDPDTAFAQSTFRVSVDAFLFRSSISPIRNTVFDQTFQTSTDGCTPSDSGFSCITRETFRMTPNSFGTFSLTGDQLDIVRGFHELGLVISLELLSFDGNTDAFRTGAFLSRTGFEAEGASARFSLDYHTTPIPLPAGAWLLLTGLGLFWAVRRQRFIAIEPAR